jgi:DHA2 family multidrug resistance protein-like MFS transporter
MPQYFQGVRGTNAMGSGVRLLPMVGGLIVGAVPADRAAQPIGAKLTVAIGFTVLGAGLVMGAATTVGSGEAFIATWMALVGAGMGLAMATASSAALVEVPEARSGVAAAMLQALNKTGGPFGAAVLGSLLSSAYRSRLDLAGLAPPAAQAVKASIFAGVDIAQRQGSVRLLDSVRVAFTHGMDIALTASAGIALAGALLTLVFLPARPRAQAPQEREHVGVG